MRKTHSYRYFKLLALCLLLPVYMQAIPVKTTANSQTEKRNVLIVNSYNESAPWSSTMIMALMSSVADMSGVEANVVHLNAHLITDDSLMKATTEGLFGRYRKQRKPECIVAIGNMAFCLRERIKQEWGDIPILLCADQDVQHPTPYYYTDHTPTEADMETIRMSSLRPEYNFTQVVAPTYPEQAVDMMHQILPQMDTLIFAADGLYQNREAEQQILRHLHNHYPQLHYRRMKPGKDNAFIRMLEADNEREGVLFSTWYYRRENLLGQPMLITGDYRQIIGSPKAVFALRNVYVGQQGGCAGAYTHDSELLKQEMTDRLQRILRGEEARKLPFYYPTDPCPRIDYTLALQRKVDTGLCPSNTIFTNRPPTLWEAYWRYLTGGVVVMLLLGALVVLSHRHQKEEITLLRKHNQLIKNMPVLYAQERIITNEQGEAIDMEFLTGNTMFRQLTRDEQTAGENNPGADRGHVEYFLQFVRVVLKEQRSVSFTYYVEHRKAFYEIIIRQTSEKNVVDIFGLDTTTLHHTEELLRTSNRKLAMALNVAHIIPWRWDLKEHTIICDLHHFHHRPDQMPEQDETEETTRTYREAEYFRNVHPDDLPRLKQQYTRLTEGKANAVSLEFRITTERNGKKQMDWMEAHTTVERRDEWGRPVSLIGSLLCITDRKLGEEELMRAKNRAEESDRLKSAFLANMSHEIRTPLNAIVGFSSILADTEEQQERQEYVSIIENNNQLLLQLISDILDLAKIEAGTLEFHYTETNLNRLMADIDQTERLKNPHGETTTLRCLNGMDHCTIWTDKNRLSQLLINLVNNALKFTPKGEVTFGYELRDEELYFYVHDTGCGIPKEHIGSVFDRFVKLNSFAKGTGLGLAICRNIVERMEGKIGVESEEGKGSTFWFTLPYRPAPVPEEGKGETHKSEQENSWTSIPPQPAVSILIAEDNESNFLLLDSILRRDYHIIHAWDGVEAVELYKAYRPSLILMDINMPRKDGLEATKEIRAISRQVPIIAITAYAYAADRERAIDSGFTGFMAKPLNANALQETIIDSLNRSFLTL